jgi:hypothetical protein
MILPINCFIVVPDPKKERTEGGLILTEKYDQNKVDTGVVTYTGENLSNMVGKKIRYRETFGEKIDINSVPHLYFRDFDSSVYYIIE